MLVCMLAALLPIWLPACGLGKKVEDGSKPWDPVPVWETQKKLLALDQVSFSHLGSKLADERWFSVSPL